MAGIASLAAVGGGAAKIALNKCGMQTLGTAALGGAATIGSIAATTALAAMNKREQALNEYNKRNGGK